MGKKHKLQRFAENETFTNLFQHHHYDIRNEGFPLKGKWHEYFGNDHPIVVELGCGRGEYTVAFAQSYPDTNFIGIDKKGARLWRGCKDAIEQNIPNAAFVRTQIDFIDYYFAPGEVSEIWVTFPDPQPKRERHRLVSPNFVDRYRKVWGTKGILNLKTDSRMLYDYLLETAAAQGWKVTANIEDIYTNPDPERPYLTSIQTYYEKKWLEQQSLISYIRVEIDNSVPSQNVE